MGGGVGVGGGGSGSGLAIFGVGGRGAGSASGREALGLGGRGAGPECDSGGAAAGCSAFFDSAGLPNGSGGRGAAGMSASFGSLVSCSPFTGTAGSAGSAGSEGAASACPKAPPRANAPEACCGVGAGSSLSFAVSSGWKVESSLNPPAPRPKSPPDGFGACMFCGSAVGCDWSSASAISVVGPAS